MSIRRRDPAKLLLVEGPTEKRLVPELMRASGAAWDDDAVGKDVPLIKELARESVQAARAIGAPVRDHDVTKSTAHTWLAWQENPGLQLHIAVKNRVLDANHPESAPFVSWFQRLFSN